jgi:hypothetical protein
MTAYIQSGGTKTITGSLANSISGTVDRYFFNFTITLSSDYYDTSTYIVITQGSDTLTSEPIYVSDLSEDLANGRVKLIEYTNLDRNISDLNRYFIDWENVAPSSKVFSFFIEGSTRELYSPDESEILETVETKTVISSDLFSGTTFKTGAIPDYMVDRLKAVSGLDFFAVNEQQYIKDGGVDSDLYGSSNLFQASINLTEKYVLGLNTDDLGITADDMEWHKQYINEAVVASIDFEEPDGYLTSNIMIKHNDSSLANKTYVKIGYSSGSYSKSASWMRARSPLI